MLAALTLFPTNLPDQGLNAVPEIIGILTTYALFLAGALAVIFIIISGVKFSTSAGDPARLKSAKSTLTYAIGGLVLVILSAAIIRTLYAILLPNGS